MASIEELEACERDIRAALKQGGLPEPDEVEHGETLIRVLWHEPQAALVVYVDKPTGLERLKAQFDVRARWDDAEVAKD